MHNSSSVRFSLDSSLTIACAEEEAQLVSLGMNLGSMLLLCIKYEDFLISTLSLGLLFFVLGLLAEEPCQDKLEHNAAVP